ncbi:NAD(P)/FAD-dependent oxidoreductase [Spirosoma sp.]|uniref:FAD-dependent oxidoreductase n=1 Tax=Spirosoma sp. TaxID=1899569 RepID=UPI0026239474|nr:NAD(P)/FAD-dependent oxidoreductase [Spirosoma sp.]MCX6216629.1 NAD(P)/FAD-dependent oxidoreductase [Spirosoma sp.]
MLIQDKQIAIIGGGPGGLTLARLLQLNGAQVKVYERDSNQYARVQGSPLDLHDESGLAALRKAGLLEEFKKNFLAGADKMVIVNGQAEIVYSDHDTKVLDNFGHTHFRPEIDRGALRKILLQSLEADTVVWNNHFASMEKQDEGWLLHFKNGTTAYADMVIAADGANSKIRPYLTDSKPFYSGITMLEGNIYNAQKSAPQISNLLRGGKVMAFGNEKDILIGQKANGEIGFYISFKTGENWATQSGLNFSDKAQLLTWFKEKYADWSPFWHELFASAKTPFIPRPIYCMPLDQSWKTQPTLTMLGDAAHVMPPFAGEGVNMAMLDALELSECLTSNKYATAQEAISVYELNMRKRAAKVAQESLENGERMHSESALTTMLDFFSAH